MKLEVKEKNFYLNNEKFQIISGAIHYFRVHPDYWKDRLLKAKAMGLNTIETYIPWNLHEPEEEKYNFHGIADIERFLKTAEEVGLYVILRPSPYICAEWEFGGFPYWILKDPSMRVRCYNEKFLSKIDRYYDNLIPKLIPYLSTNGGPVIAVQIENEYGSYGNDKKYLKYSKEALIKRGVDVLLFTSDGPSYLMLNGGKVDKDTLQTANFGSDPEGAFKILEDVQPNGPYMCTEYWNGWFDHWGEEHHVRGFEDAANVLDRMLSMGASVNLYMFHGGTNFGFYNGANFDLDNNKIQPTVTSYDYDCALSECGDITPKYEAFKEVISKYTSIPQVELKNIKKLSYGKVNLNEKGMLFKNLNNICEKINSSNTLSMEELGQDYGYTLYETNIDYLYDFNLSIDGLCDRASIFVDDEYVGTLYRNDEKNSMVIKSRGKNINLKIIVENLGRINYGPKIGEGKGILKGVKVDYQYHFGWNMYPVKLNNIQNINFDNSICENTPMFYKGSFNVNESGDTFLKLDGWKKGVVFINGFNIGRYWEEGPQKTLYVPSPLLKSGENEIVVFELEGCKDAVVEFIDNPILG